MTKRLTIPFSDEEYRRLEAVADECGESPADYVRSISLATCTPPVDGARAEKPVAAKGTASSPADGGGALVVLDESQKPVKCGGCGQETIRAKSERFPRTYAALYREIDWTQKPARARRHMCVAARG